jgi:hypothetical protein
VTTARAIRQYALVSGETVGTAWRRLRDDLSERAIKSKDSMNAVFELSGAYADLRDEDRAEVNTVLGEWVLSDSEALRYDALFVVADHAIRDLVPVLRLLQQRLEDQPTGPRSPYEWAKVNRLLGELTAPTQEGGSSA